MSLTTFVTMYIHWSLPSYLRGVVSSILGAISRLLYPALQLILDYLMYVVTLLLFGIGFRTKQLHMSFPNWHQFGT